MKKKLFLATLMVAMLVCVFALSVSAVTGSTSNEYGTVTYVDGMSEVNGYDTTSRAVLQNADGTYTTYPAYYIYNGKTGADMRMSLTNLNTATGENYTSASLIRVEVFENSRLNWTFQDCSSLIDVYLPDSVYFHYASFTGCSSLTTIKIPSAATQIPTECFNSCVSLTNIDIPNTVTSLGKSAFQNCNSLSEIKFPEGYTGVVPQDFRKIINGKTSIPVTYIIPKSCTGVNSNYSLDNCNVEKIIFTGTSDSDFVKSVTEKASNWVSKIEYANHCEYYYDNVHDTEMKYVFTSFVDECYEEGVCSRCGEKKIGETYAPIFEFLGYSTNGKNICAGYTICLESTDKYNEVNSENKLKYGFIASANNNTPINADGTFIENSVNVDLSEAKYVAFDFVLTGDFSVDKNANAEISMNLYTITKDENGANVINYVYGYNDGDVIVSEVYNVADNVTFSELNQ